MKKIGILTLKLSNNYGGILQAYALNKYLRNLGYEATTLDIEPRPLHFSLFKRVLTGIWRIIKRIKGDKSLPFLDIKKQYEAYNIAGTYQSKFIKEYIPTVKTSNQITKQFALDNPFDAYIVGSDQVWRPSFTDNILNYFLDFVPEHVTKVSYASSFGINTFDIDSQTKDLCSSLYKRFSGISVREEEAIKLCKELSPTKKVEWLVDPTLLLDVSDYKNLIKAFNYKSRGNNLLVVYILDLTIKKISFIERIAKKLGLEILYIGKIQGSQFPPIEEWLGGFMDAKYIITDSFHGTVFSLIFNVPFITIANTGRGYSRFESLFKKFNLKKDRLLDEHSLEIPPSYEYFKCNINFAEINNIIKQERQKSHLFIKSTVGQ